MTKIPVKRYSEAFKKQVVAEYESGISIKALNDKYGITGWETIKNWIMKYGKDGFRHEVVTIQRVEERKREKELEKRVEELEQTLGKVVLEKFKLESILEEVAETYGVEVKKNAVRSSPDLPRKSSNNQDGQ